MLKTLGSSFVLIIAAAFFQCTEESLYVPPEAFRSVYRVIDRTTGLPREISTATPYDYPVEILVTELTGKTGIEGLVRMAHIGYQEIVEIPNLISKDLTFRIITRGKYPPDHYMRNIHAIDFYQVTITDTTITGLYAYDGFTREGAIAEWIPLYFEAEKIEE